MQKCFKIITEVDKHKQKRESLELLLHIYAHYSIISNYASWKHKSRICDSCLVEKFAYDIPVLDIKVFCL